MVRELWFDLDGTIADLYGVVGWLTDLQEGRTRPYKVAKPCLHLSTLARLLHKAQGKGYKICVISWTSRTGTKRYNAEIARVKREWLKQHLPSVAWDTIDIVKYGTPKQEGRAGILFDDEEGNRLAWGEQAYTPDKIFEVLRRLE